jgi:hypothetical protein
VTDIDDQVLRAICISLQFDLAAEVYTFTSTKPRFPNRINVGEKLSQLPLVAQFFNPVPQQAQVLEVGHAEQLVSALGAVHAISNSIGFWQAVKGALAFLGDRKGQLTPKLNQHIYASVSTACGASIAAEVTKAVRQRSKQVKAGIKASGSHKSFTAFGMQELADLVGARSASVSDLAQLTPQSVALSSDDFQSRKRSYHIHHQSFQIMEAGARALLSDMVNPSEEVEA